MIKSVSRWDLPQASLFINTRKQGILQKSTEINLSVKVKDLSCTCVPKITSKRIGSSDILTAAAK